MLWLPLLARCFRLEPARGASENRRLAPRPRLELTGKGLRSFPAEMDAYYSDHFGFRASLLRWLCNVKVHWLGVSSCPNVILGTDGWLFYAGEPVGNDYESARPFTASELARWQHRLEQRRDWLAQRGIRYLFLVAPDAQSIYPEHLPPALRKRQAESRLDQLVSYLAAHSDLPILDVRGAMREAKARERLYHRTDTHWNSRGAFVAYEELTRHLAHWFPAIQPLPRTAFHDVVQEADRGGDLARMLNLTDQYREEVLDLQPKAPRLARLAAGSRPPSEAPAALPKPMVTECPTPGLPRAVIFHDSFFLGVYPFLSEHFHRAAYLWQYSLDRGLIEREHPDVVIQEVVERYLRLPDHDEE
jgi:hypothetical protein